MVSKCRRSHQLFNEDFPLLARFGFVAKKFPNPIGLGWLTGKIQKGPPDEFGVCAQRAWREFHPLELCVDVGVYEIVLRSFGPCPTGAIPHDRYFTRSVKSLVSNQYGHFSSSNRREGVIFNHRDFLVVTAENRITRHIPGRSIWVGSQDQKALQTPGQIDIDHRRKNRNTSRPGRHRLRAGAFSNPLLQEQVCT